MILWDELGLVNPAHTNAEYLEGRVGPLDIRFTKKSIVYNHPKDALGVERVEILYYWGSPQIRKTGRKRWRRLHET